MAGRSPRARPRSRGWGGTGRNLEAGRAHGDGRLVGLAKLMQPLAALAHEVLAAGQAELPVGRQRHGQFSKPLPLGLGDASKGLGEGAGHKAAEAFLASLEIPKPPLSLQLQRLLQGLQPGLKGLWGQGVLGAEVLGAACAVVMSCSHSCSASSD